MHARCDYENVQQQHYYYDTHAWIYIITLKKKKKITIIIKRLKLQFMFTNVRRHTHINSKRI